MTEDLAEKLAKSAQDLARRIDQVLAVEADYWMGVLPEGSATPVRVRAPPDVYEVVACQRENPQVRTTLSSVNLTYEDGKVTLAVTRGRKP